MNRSILPLMTVLLILTYWSVGSAQRRSQPSPSPAPSPSPRPTLTSLGTAFAAGNLEIVFTFNNDISAFDKSSLTYTLIAETGAVFPAAPGQLAVADKSNLVFHIPISKLAQAPKLIAAANLADGRTEATALPKVEVDLRHFNELSKTAEQLDRLTKDKTDLASKLKQAQADLDVILEGHQPHTVNYEKTNLVTDEKIVISFNTAGIPGRIRATITGPDGFKREQESPSISTLHTIAFDGLKDSKPYEIKAEALGLRDKQPIPGVSIDASREARLKVSTTKQVNPPVVSAKVTPASDRISVSVTSDQEVFVEVEYRELLDPSAGKFGPTQRVGLIKADDFGTFTGDSLVAAQTSKAFVLTDVKESSRYEVIVKAVNRVGKSPSRLIETTIDTLRTPIKFEFGKTLNVQMSPLGVKVDWNATANIKDAFLEVVYDGDTTFVGSKKAKVVGSSATAVLEVGDVSKMAAKLSPPIIRLRMNDDTTTVERELQVSFIVPDKKTVEANAQLPTQMKNDLLSLVGNIEKQKGINWKSLLSSGLSILVRTFAPIP